MQARAQVRAGAGSRHFAEALGYVAWLARAGRGLRGRNGIVLLLHPASVTENAEARMVKAAIARQRLGEAFIGERL